MRFGILIAILCILAVVSPAIAGISGPDCPQLGANNGLSDVRVDTGDNGRNADDVRGAVRETVQEIRNESVRQVQEIREQVRENVTDDTNRTIREAQRETVQLVQTVREQSTEQVQIVRATSAENVTALRATIREQRELVQAANANLSEQRRLLAENQNEVRLAVHTLLAMENLTGGIGPQVSAIAREFNNSAQANLAYEERIQNRDTFSRLLFGGDRAAAAQINQTLAQNQARIEQLTQLMQGADLDPDTQQLMQEQLQVLQMEQDRLRLLVQQETANRGLFGWLF